MAAAAAGIASAATISATGVQGSSCSSSDLLGVASSTPAPRLTPAPPAPELIGAASSSVETAAVDLVAGVAGGAPAPAPADTTASTSSLHGATTTTLPGGGGGSAMSSSAGSLDAPPHASGGGIPDWLQPGPSVLPGNGTLGAAQPSPDVKPPPSTAVAQAHLTTSKEPSPELLGAASLSVLPSDMMGTAIHDPGAAVSSSGEGSEPRSSSQPGLSGPQIFNLFDDDSDDGGDDDDQESSPTHSGGIYAAPWSAKDHWTNLPRLEDAQASASRGGGSGGKEPGISVASPPSPPCRVT